jgi:hypothetical protein
MKGLLIKDLNLLKNMMRVMIAIVIFSVVFSTVGENLFFCMGYVSVFVAVFSISTISYDEYDNGFAYLFCFPFERKHYVQEKYLFGLGMIIIGVLFSAAVSFGISGYQGELITIPELAAVSVASMSIAIFMISLVLPAHIKYGSEKGRVAMIVIFLVVGVIGGAVYGLTTMLGIDLEGLIEPLFYSPVKMLLIAGVFAVLAMTCSYLLSVKIIEKKEF